MGLGDSESKATSTPRHAHWGWRLACGLLAVLAVSGLLAMRENARLKSEREHSIPLTRSDFFLASLLVSEYTRGRAEQGAWPEPAQIQKELPLVESKRHAQYPMRIDLYQTNLPDVTLQVELHDDGGLFFKVNREKVARAPYSTAKRVTVEFRRARDEPAPGYTKRTIAGKDDTVYVHELTDLSNDEIADAWVSSEGAGGRDRAVIMVRFTPEGRTKMEWLSQQLIGKMIAVLVDGEVVDAAYVRLKLADRAIIEGQFTASEAERIARGLRPNR